MCSMDDKQYLEDACICDLFEEILQRLIQVKPPKSEIRGFLGDYLLNSSPSVSPNGSMSQMPGSSGSGSGSGKPLSAADLPIMQFANQSPRARLTQKDEPNTLRVTFGVQVQTRPSVANINAASGDGGPKPKKGSSGSEGDSISMAFEDIVNQIKPHHTDILIVDHYSTVSLQPLVAILAKNKQVTSLVFISCTFLSRGPHSLQALHEVLTGARCGVEELAFDGCSFVSKINAWRPGEEDEVSSNGFSENIASLFKHPEGTSVRSLYVDQLNSESVVTIFKALASPKAPLLDLVLHESVLDTFALAALTSMLKQNSILQGLSLANSSLSGEDAALAVADALATNRALRILDISHMAPEPGCVITEEGLAEIIVALENNPGHQLADLYVATADGGPHISTTWQSRLHAQLRKNATLLSDPNIALLPINFWRGSTDE